MLAAEGLPSVGWVPRRQRERESDLAVRAAGRSAEPLSSDPQLLT
jgi:hypothetical protein